VYLLLRRFLKQLGTDGVGKTLLVMVLLYLISHLLLALVEGRDSPFADPVDFWYFFVVTVTTVGYGDISPATDAGKLIASVMILTGLGLAAILLTRIGTFIYDLATRKRRGLVNTKHTGHAVLLFEGQDVMFIKGILYDILADKNRRKLPIVVGSDNEEHHRLLNDEKISGRDVEVKYADGVHTEEMMRRVGIADAARVGVRCREDGSTILTLLTINKLNTTAHIVAMLHERENERHVGNIPREPPIKAVVPLQVLVAIQEMQDPELSRLLAHQLTNGTDSTFYRVDIPAAAGPWEFRVLREQLHERYGCLVTAVVTADKIYGAPEPSMQVEGGMALFLTAQRRPGDEIAWGELG